MEKAVDNKKALTIFRSFDDVLNITLTEIEYRLFSAMADAVRCVLGRDHKNLAVLGDALMCIYLADLIHNKIEAFEWGQHEVDGRNKFDRQYAVLVGDYLHSESFMLLISHQIYKQISLHHLTGLVKIMKRGALQRWEFEQKQGNKDGLPLVWEMERGALVSLYGRLAAEILEAETSVAAKIDSLGRCLGMAWAAGIEREFDAAPFMAAYLDEANELICELEMVGDMSAFRELLDYLADQLGAGNRRQREKKISGCGTMVFS